MKSGNSSVRCFYFKVICPSAPHLEEPPLPKWAAKVLQRQQKFIILDCMHMSKRKSSSAEEVTLYFA